MATDWGTAVATGDFVGPTAEAIVIVDGPFAKHLRAPHGWDTAVWIRKDPRDAENFQVLRAAFVSSFAPEARLQSTVPLTGRGELGVNARGSMQSLASPAAEAAIATRGEARIARIPWQLDPASGLGWTFVQNAVEYEVERSIGGDEAELVYVGPNPAFADYTVNSAYRVRGKNEYGVGPWSPQFVVFTTTSSIRIDTRFVSQEDRESFVHVNVSSFGGGRKRLRFAAPVGVQVQAGGGGRREGVAAGALVAVRAEAGVRSARAGGGGAGVLVHVAGGAHRGAIVNLEALGALRGAFQARPAEDQVVRPLVTSGRVRRRSRI